MVCDGDELKGSAERALDPRERETGRQCIQATGGCGSAGSQDLASCWMHPTVEIFTLESGFQRDDV